MINQNHMVEIEDLVVTYSKSGRAEHTSALTDITLSIQEGEFVAVIGSSGAGKTTLLRSLTGFVRPISGKLIVNGVNMAHIKTKNLYKVRREVATIYQHFNLVERMTAFDNVLCGRLGYISNLRSLFKLFSKKDREYAYRTLVGLGLKDRALNRVDQLSGGERQRVAIARALVQEPFIVLADEPASSLDISLTKFVLDTLNSLNQKGLTILVNLHDIELAKKYATRIIALQKGQLVFDDRPEKLTEEILEGIFNES